MKDCDRRGCVWLIYGDLVFAIAGTVNTASLCNPRSTQSVSAAGAWLGNDREYPWLMLFYTAWADKVMFGWMGAEEVSLNPDL